MRGDRDCDDVAAICASAPVFLSAWSYPPTTWGHILYPVVAKKPTRKAAKRPAKPAAARKKLPPTREMDALEALLLLGSLNDQDFYVVVSRIGELYLDRVREKHPELSPQMLDAIRDGTARERKLAEKELIKSLRRSNG